MNKPRISEADALKIVEFFEVNRDKYPVVLVGIRGYYLNSMGKVGENDRKIYDDCAIWVTPKGCVNYNFNVDPNGNRPGEGTGSKKGMANLKEGVWLYQKGIHKTYPAFRQAAAVTVIRDGYNGKNYEDTGWFGINIHKGGMWSTSSLGCQTVPLEQWDSFKSFGYKELSEYGQKTFPYILIDEQKRKNI